MPLRPIDVIFTEPKEHYYVVYQNGALYQLTRMKLDIKSWERRIPFTGNIETIVVSKNQNIQDPQLKNILNTQKLPNSLYGRNLPFFKGWWEANGYQWSQDNPTQDESTQSELKKGHKEHLEQGNQISSPEALRQQVAHVPTEKTTKDTKAVDASPATAVPSHSQNEPTSVKSHESEDVANNLKPKIISETNASNDKATDEDNFFDNLLSDLNH